MAKNKTASSLSKSSDSMKTESLVIYSVYLGVISVYLGTLMMISNQINDIQPIPYLDEIYHIPQAQEYCRGNFSYWDNRITTLPGLYLFSVGIITPLSNLVDYSLCELSHLRFTNICLSVFNFLLYIWLTSNIHKLQCSKWKALLSALNMATFPPLFFFAFLYYTDVAAASMVLLMYSLHISGKNNLAAVAGIGAVLVRQTNIIWTILVAVKCMDESLQSLLLTPSERKANMLTSWRQVPLLVKKFFSVTPLSRKLLLLARLLSRLVPYILVGVLFLVFVVVNNGLVVGDRAAHQASINTPQLFYFFGVVTAFGAPHWLTFIKPFMKSCLRNWRLLLVISAAASVIIRYNTLVHPYLLADNRHYTFYIWKRVFEYHPAGRFLMIPIYLFGAYVTYRTMVKTSFLYSCSFLVCCFLVLVPQRLLEIRYFFIPFLLVRLNIAPRSWLGLVLESIMFNILNAATLYLFVSRPFYWSDSPLIQRFMW